MVVLLVGVNRFDYSFDDQCGCDGEQGKNEEAEQSDSVTKHHRHRA